MARLNKFAMNNEVLLFTHSLLIRNEFTVLSKVSHGRAYYFVDFIKFIDSIYQTFKKQNANRIK